MPNNISTNKKTSPISRLKSQSLFSSYISSQSSSDLRLSPHYLIGPPFAIALPHRTSVRHRTTLLNLGDLFLFSILMGFAIFWLIWPLLYFDIFMVWVCLYFEIRIDMGLILVGNFFFLVHAILVFQLHYLSSSILFIC